jgi:probable rRNA maturation factor
VTSPLVHVDIAARSPLWGRSGPRLKTLLREAARLAVARGTAAGGIKEAGPVELGITLADDALQARLNRLYRANDGPTNVLSFPAAQGADRPPQMPLLLGDIVLAYETASREAREQRKPLADHLRHLLVHGVLHLLGFDHEASSEALAMESLEQSILAELGVPDPYRDTMSSVGAQTNPNERDRAAR